MTQTSAQLAASPVVRPLAGLRVLELARILAGPWVGQLLADLGAAVVKVERTGAGDDTRAWGPPFEPAADFARYIAAEEQRYRTLATGLKLE